METKTAGTMERRLGAAAIIAGALIMAVTTGVHPPVIDHRAHLDVAETVRQHTSLWIWIHWGAALGFTLWRLGLVALHAYMTRSQRPLLSTAALGLSWMAGALWLFLFVTEAVAFPELAASPFSGTEIFSALWATTIIIGFVATGMDGLSILFWSTCLLSLEGKRSLQITAWLGIATGLLLAAASVAAVLAPATGLLLMAPAGVGFLLWSYRTAAMLWESARLNGGVA